MEPCTFDPLKITTFLWKLLYLLIMPFSPLLLLLEALVTLSPCEIRQREEARVKRSIHPHI